VSTNPRGQAIVLFLLVPIGILGLLAKIETHNVPLAIMFAGVTAFALGLGIWLWTKPW